MHNGYTQADLKDTNTPKIKFNWSGKRIFLSVLAHLSIFLIYSVTLSFAVLAPLARRILRLKKEQRAPGEIQILVTGTFYNEGWIRGHLVPLAMSQAVKKVWVVSDTPWSPHGKVRYVTPPSWLRQIFGRSLSRAIMVFTTAVRQKPDLLMGYHIMPNSLICLITASILGAHSAFQMTGGPIQIIGGGSGSENSLLRLLGRESILLERLLFATVRHFDLVVVRGQSALAFTRENNLGKKQIVITAGIDTDIFQPGDTLPEYDTICVSRLVSGKGLEYLLETLNHCHQNGHKVTAAIVGDGPLQPTLSGLLAKYGLSEYVSLLGRRNDISRLLQTAKIFVLTSPSEGMSIALLEALATGLPAAITQVGDLGDAVKEGINGLFLDGKDSLAAAFKLMGLLENESMIKSMSTNARRVAETRYSIKAIAQHWDNYLSGPPPHTHQS